MYKRFIPYISESSVNDFHSVMFHCPFYKLVQKAFARLVFADFINGKNSLDELNELKEMDRNTSYTNKKFSTTAISVSDELLKEKVEPNMILNRRIGNMYTPSLYAQLITLLSRYAFLRKRHQNN